MKTHLALLILAVAAGCSTQSPLSKPAETAPPVVLSALPADLNSGTVDILGLHGQVQYWDGNRWATLRPNMLLTNGAQLRPGPDCYVNISCNHVVTIRLETDHRQNLQAYVVRHLGGVEVASVTSSAPPALRIHVGGVNGRAHNADFAIFTNGNVEALRGQMMVMGGGKSWGLNDGDYLDAEAGKVAQSSLGRGQSTRILRPTGACLTVSVPKSKFYDLGMNDFWGGKVQVGD